mmetsp:Transcript_23082/g.62647  ORF Transcript_23082/g.62647 Transcript_23082/m.62647 type:complete len:209 (-) Transcript_23082:326-952(-)
MSTATSATSRRCSRRVRGLTACGTLRRLLDRITPTSSTSKSTTRARCTCWRRARRARCPSSSTRRAPLLALTPRPRTWMASLRLSYPSCHCRPTWWSTRAPRPWVRWPCARHARRASSLSLWRRTRSTARATRSSGPTCWRQRALANCAFLGTGRRAFASRTWTTIATGSALPRTACDRGRPSWASSTWSPTGPRTPTRRAMASSGRR